MRGRDPLDLTLTLIAVAAAGVGQWAVHRSPWLALAGFALGMVLFAVAERSRSQAPEPDVTAPSPMPRRFLVLFAAGCLVCFGAGFAVCRHGPATLTHGVWMVGLELFVASAWCTGQRREPRRQPGRVLAAVALLVMVSAALFGWQLTSIPPEVHGDDAEVGLDAIRLLEHFNLFSAGWFELPRFHALPTAIGLKLFGVNLLGLRITSAFLGGGTVLLLFAVARRLWGFEVALLAALLLASQRFFIHLSRTGYHYIDTAFVSVLVVWLFLRVWRERRLAAAIWCGIALGLGIQTYYASRLVPVILAVTWLLWLVGTNRAQLRSRAAEFALIVLSALATAAPMFGYFANDWHAFWERTSDTSIFNPASREHLSFGYGTDNLGAILLIQARAALTMFNVTGDNSVQYGYQEAFFEPVSAALFVLGVALACAGLRQRRNQLLLVWTAVPLIAGVMLTIDAPFYPRISGVVPFAALLVGLALQRILLALRNGLPGSGGHWVAAMGAAGALAVVFGNNINTYFLDYAPLHRHSPSVAISEWVRRHGAGKTTHMVGAAPHFYIGHGAISFLTYGYDTYDIISLSRFLRSRPLDPATSLFIIWPTRRDLIPVLADAVGALDVQEHRNIHGDIDFLTAIPRASYEAGVGDAAARAPPRSAPAWGGEDEPSQDKVRLVETAGSALLLGGLVIGGVLLLAFWANRPRRFGVATFSPRWCERPARLRRVVFGPDERERRFEPRRAVTTVLLVLIVAGSAVARIYRLDDIPAGFFCDEAGLGYNAYSIFRTGRDETGTFLPLYVWSFGVSYKNPVFIYSSIVPMALLGPSEFAVRLTSALYGSGTVAAMFFLGRAVMGVWVGLLAALFLAVAPWHLHFSRIAFELITFPFFFVLGVTALVRYTRGDRTLPRAMVLLGLSLYTYVPAKLFVPLFVTGFAAIFHRTLLRRWRESALALVLLGIVIAPVVTFDLRNMQRAGSYLEETTMLSRDAPWSALLRDFAHNYAAFFSPAFLFRQGDPMIRHAVQEHGELYPFFAPLILIGLLAAVGRRDPIMLVPLGWLALYPVAPALMNEIPSASRGIIGVPAFCLLAAVGGGAILRLPALALQRRAIVISMQLLALGAGAAVLAPQVGHYWSLYSGDYREYAAKYYTGFQFGHRQVVKYFRDHYDEYDRLILTTRENNQPRIFLRFYAALDGPVSGAVPPLEKPEKMDRGSPAELHLYAEYRRLLFAVLPEELRLFADYEVKQTILAPDGSPAYLLVAVRAPSVRGSSLLTR